MSKCTAHSFLDNRDKWHSSDSRPALLDGKNRYENKNMKHFCHFSSSGEIQREIENGLRSTKEKIIFLNKCSPLVYVKSIKSEDIISIFQTVPPLI